MNVALPEAMREYIDSRVTSGQYGNTSELDELRAIARGECR